MIHCTSLSVHCGQSGSIKGVGVMEDGRRITPYQQPSLNLPSDKTQSLPGFYNRPSSSPPHKFKEDFNSKKKFHPYIKADPCVDVAPSKYAGDAKAKSKIGENLSSPRNFGQVDDNKKSRRFLGGLFKRRKKAINSGSSSSECDAGGIKQKVQNKNKKREQSKCESKQPKHDKRKETEGNANDSALAPDQEYRSNYVIQTVTGKVMKMSPTRSLGREFSSHPNAQPLGVPPLTMASPSYLGRSGVSVSHDSLTPSAISWNSESAYGSINSSIRSSRLGRSSSNDTLNRKERRVALKSRVEKIRDKVHNSSSDEDAGSIISSQFGSENSLNRADSISNRSRGARTERYIRRKTQELQTLKVETEKDRRNREVVQARILEIQKSQRLKGAKSELNFTNLQSHYHHRGASHMRSLPSNANAQSSFSLSTEPYSSMRSNISNTYLSQAQRSVSYDTNIHQYPFARPSKFINHTYMNSEGLVPPAPPPRDKSRVVSPMDSHRPMSYSFENLSHDPNQCSRNTNGIPYPFRSSFHKSSSPSPYIRAAPCSSPVPSNEHLPPTSPCKKSLPEKQVNSNDYTQPFRPAPPKVYIPFDTVVSATDISRPVNDKNEKGFSKCIPITSMPPSPSSDYSSYISDNSSRISHNQHCSLPIEIETKQSANCTVVSSSVPFNILPISSLSVSCEGLPDEGQFNSSQDEGELHRAVIINVRDKCNSVERVTSPVNKPVPQPPKRNSSSLSKTTGEYLRKHLEMLNTFEQSDGEDQRELHKKMEEAFIKEKERLEKNKCINFEEALKELELIYQSLNLNSDDIIDGAEKRDSGAVIEPNLEGERTIKKTSADKTADDLHLRRVNLNNKKNPNVKKMLENTGSYMLVSPIHVPLELELSNVDQRSGKKEPDVICDDVTYRNAQRANAFKVLDPQPLFGIPIGPVTQCSNTDYLHSSPTPDLPPISKKEPNVVTDDLAFRNLRKDLKSASNKSLNTSELDEILSEANESPLFSRRSQRSASVDRVSALGCSSAISTKRPDLQTPRRVKQHQKTKRGGKFYNSFKDACTDNEGDNTSFQHWKPTGPSWVERANLGINKWDAASTSTETLTDISSMKARSQPDIRQAIINESKNADGGPEDPFAFLIDPRDQFPKDEEKELPLLVKVQAMTESHVVPVNVEPKSFKQIDVVYNNKPKPFYLTNKNKEHLPVPISLVDIAKLDDLISSISGMEQRKSDAKMDGTGSKKETDIFNEGLEVAKINIEKAIRGSLSSSNSEVHR